VPFHDIEWPALGLVEDAAKIFAYDAQRHQLHAAKEQHHGHQARIAGRRVAKEDGADDELEDVKPGEKCRHEPEIGRNLERPHGEAGNPLQREVPQLPVIPLGLARRAGCALIGHGDGREAHPGEQALHEAVLLAQLQQRIQ